MTTPSQPDASNSYFLDPESAAELARLIQMHQYTTRAMGGVLAEQPDPTAFHTILDCACGPGGWVLDMAYASPKAEAVGIDISQSMISYAAMRARSQGLNNAFFQVMDITKPLEFSDASFDLVNARFLGGVLYNTIWPSFLRECVRVVKPGGVIRLTETDSGGMTNSAAFEQLNLLAVRALQKSGHAFYPQGNTFCLTPTLEELLRNAGCDTIQSSAHVINFSAGTDVHMDFCRSYEVGGQLAQSFLVATGVATAEEVTQLRQQTLRDMFSDNFRAIWYFLTVWGRRPTSDPGV